jgi:hypothetical protein
MYSRTSHLVQTPTAVATSSLFFQFLVELAVLVIAVTHVTDISTGAPPPGT